MATYLGEKLHTNVQLPAILPGARGAALLWQGAAAATGLVLGAGQVYGGAAPFGLAFTMVCPRRRPPAPRRCWRRGLPG